MAAYRFPILLWQDFGNQFGGCAVESPEDATAIAPTRAAVIDQLKDYLSWAYKKNPWRTAPEYQDSTLTQFSVQVRPEYIEKNRIYPSEPVTLRVACVHGRLDDRLLYGTLPMLGVTFNYHAGDQLRDTVTHYVQQALKGKTLPQLLGFLPPKVLELDELVIQVSRPTRLPVKSPEVKNLDAVADPISSRRYRSSLSKPWERETEVARLTTLLAKEQTSAILVGPSGVGKSAILLESTRRVPQIAPDDENDPTDRSTSTLPRFWLTSAARMIAGMKYLGQWQERCDALIAELSQIGGVLCVERLLDLVLGGSGDPASGVGAYLVPFLQRGELRLIAEATPEELDTCRRLLPSLVDACQILTIPPLTRTQAIAAIEQVAKIQAQNSRVTLEPSAVPLAFRLFNRFQPYLPMPGPAVQFITELFDTLVSRKESRLDDRTVFDAFTRKSGLPDWLLHDELPLARDEVRAHFSHEIIGQDPACAAATDVILTFKAGIHDPHRPLAVLFFAGPTGVGKTELAKTLSRYLFGHGGDTNRLIRLDMSEYAGPGAATRLLGPPHGEPSTFIQRIRQQPFSVVLLDEIEKASPEVFDLLLGLFDEGRLTDRFGRLTNFRSSILIMTSNLGASSTNPFGLSRSPASSQESEILSFFRPEFFNRMDAIVPFNELTPASMRSIATKELREIAAREGLVQRGITLRWTPALVDHLVQMGFDRRYGARPLQRTIETLIVTPLAKVIASDNHDRKIALADVEAGTVTLRFSQE